MSPAPGVNADASHWDGFEGLKSARRPALSRRVQGAWALRKARTARETRATGQRRATRRINSTKAVGPNPGIITAGHRQRKGTYSRRCRR
jgi:hypothetical protein